MQNKHYTRRSHYIAFYTSRKIVQNFSHSQKIPHNDTTIRRLESQKSTIKRTSVCVMLFHILNTNRSIYLCRSRRAPSLIKYFITGRNSSAVMRANILQRDMYINKYMCMNKICRLRVHEERGNKTTYQFLDERICGISREFLYTLNRGYLVYFYFMYDFDKVFGIKKIYMDV